MSEQQRVFLAVILCMGIFLVSQFVAMRNAPKETTATQSQTTAPAAPSLAPVVAPDGPPESDGQVVHRQTVAAKAEQRVFETMHLRGTLNNQQAGLSLLELTQYRGDPKQGDTDALSLSPKTAVQGPAEVQPQDQQARLVWQGSGSAPPLSFVPSAPGTFMLSGVNDQQMEVSVHVVPRPEAYGIDYTVKVKNKSNVPQTAAAAVRLVLPGKSGEEGHSFLGAGGTTTQVSGVCDVAGAVEREDFASVSKKTIEQSGVVRWAALDRQYFVVAAVPGEAADRCTMRAAQNLYELLLHLSGETLAPDAEYERHFALYAGPKRDDQMSTISPLLKDVIDFNIWHIPLGFVARPMVAMLNTFHRFTNSWGVAIMLLTLVVKLILFPVTYKSVLSMRRMQLLKPELDRIKKQYENDKERQQLEQMKLFREKGVNPIGGCLPMLAQVPVWLALYRMLWSAVDLYHQPFLWLTDLTAKEPFPVLALILGAVTVVQQRLTPTPADNQQAKIMMVVMPLMLTFFMIALPSGLVLYVLVNSVLTIIQQLAINRRAVTV